MIHEWALPQKMTKGSTTIACLGAKIKSEAPADLEEPPQIE